MPNLASPVSPPSPEDVARILTEAIDGEHRCVFSNWNDAAAVLGALLAVYPQLSAQHAALLLLCERVEQFFATRHPESDLTTLAWRLGGDEQLMARALYTVHEAAGWEHPAAFTAKVSS